MNHFDDEKAQHLRSTDKRFVYSMSCTFSGSIYQTSLRNRIPCCPSCTGYLYEMESADKWNALVAAHAEQNKDPKYPAFVKWFGDLRPCRRIKSDSDIMALRIEFDALPPAPDIIKP